MHLHTWPQVCVCRTGTCGCSLKKDRKGTVTPTVNQYRTVFGLEQHLAWNGIWPLLCNRHQWLPSPFKRTLDQKGGAQRDSPPSERCAEFAQTRHGRGVFCAEGGSGWVASGWSGTKRDVVHQTSPGWTGERLPEVKLDKERTQGREVWQANEKTLRCTITQQQTTTERKCLH